jgi:phosphohistidine phosphatase SixA
VNNEWNEAQSEQAGDLVDRERSPTGARQVDIVLVRHGVHHDHALSDRGRHQAVMLSQAFGLRGTEPTLLLSSSLQHAQETARLLAEHAASQGLPAMEPVPLAALTPKCGPGGFDDVIRQAEAVGAGLEFHSCVLVVGHEGRLSDLVTELTGVRLSPVASGGAVCIRGQSLQDLVAGRGSVHYHYPTVDHQEEPIRAKINSKMTVSTFLAGFVFTALSAVLLLPLDTWPLHRVVAASALTAALVLLIAAVYIYDQMGTPSGFWTDADKPRLFWRRLYERREARLERLWAKRRKAAPKDLTDEEKARWADDHPIMHRPLHDGPAYWMMVRTSRFVFTPGVVLALMGFIGLLIGTGDWRIFTFGVLGLVATGAYCALQRPNLGAD